MHHETKRRRRHLAPAQQHQDQNSVGQVEDEKTVGRSGVAQLRRIHANRDQSRNREEHPGRCQPALRPANLTWVRRDLWSTEETMVRVSRQSDHFPREAKPTGFLELSRILLTRKIGGKQKFTQAMAQTHSSANPRPILVTPVDYFSNQGSLSSRSRIATRALVFAPPLPQALDHVGRCLHGDPGSGCAGSAGVGSSLRASFRLLGNSCLPISIVIGGFWIGVEPALVK